MCPAIAPAIPPCQPIHASEAWRSVPGLPPDQERALALATRHVNASTPIAITPDALLAALRGGPVPQRLAHHVFAFLDETETATLADLVISGAVTYAQLASLADQLLAEQHRTRTWLDDRRAF